MINLAYLLERSARHFAQKPAALFRESLLSYQELNDRVCRLASGLLKLGLCPKDRVALIIESEPRGLESIFGPLRAGMTIVPIGNRLHVLEQLYIIENSGATAIICNARFADGLISSGRLPPGIALIVIDAHFCGLASPIDYEQVIGNGNSRTPARDVDGDDVAWLFYTSGTTGRPKGAMLTNRNLTTMINCQLIEHNAVSSDDRFAYLTPLSHGSGLATFLQMARGATHVFPEPGGFAARPFYELVAKLGVTSCQMVPTQIQTLLDSPPTGEDDLSTLKTIGYGAAPMYVDRLKEAITIFGPIFTQTYGLGEAPRGITCLPKRDHVVRDADSERRLGSVGRECLYVQVRTVDDEGHAMPTGTEGEVAVKGELITKGYWNNAAATEELIRDGWLYTGDIGYFDEAGYLFLTDRKKDVIITGGSNVYPREVEEVLYRHPAVQEACVVGEPDKRWGERITAAIVRRVGEEISEISIADWCKSQIASYKKPSRVVFLESLPKSSVGKILRREVQRLIRDLEAQQQSSRNCPMDSNT